MHSTLFDRPNLEVQGAQRFALQNPQMLRVSLGADVLSVKGVDGGLPGVGHVHPRRRRRRRAAAEEDGDERGRPVDAGVRLGEVFFASEAGFVYLVDLTGDALSVNSRNLLAFDAAVGWDIKRVQGAGMMAGGLYNTVLQGTGTVALHAVGQPVILDCSSQPTYVDVQAAVAWSANLVPQVVSSMNMRSMLRGGTGEAFQYAFHGQGFVVGPAERVGPGARWAAAGERRAASAACSTEAPGCPTTHRCPTRTCWPRCAPTSRPPASPSTVSPRPGAAGRRRARPRAGAPGRPGHPRHGRAGRRPRPAVRARPQRDARPPRGGPADGRGRRPRAPRPRRGRGRPGARGVRPAPVRRRAARRGGSPPTCPRRPTNAPLAPDHVLGIGGASTTLASWTPRPAVGTALDLGTGCGVQSLHLAAHARSVTATDLSARALAFARFNAALNGSTWELLQGSLLEPVAGRRFDLVVSNPPFVITPRVGRGAAVRVPRRRAGRRRVRARAWCGPWATTWSPAASPSCSATGRSARRRRPGASGWTQWLDGTGLDAWVIQRDEQDPAQYAETWARDGGHRPERRLRRHVHRVAGRLRRPRRGGASASGWSPCSGRRRTARRGATWWR